MDDRNRRISSPQTGAAVAAPFDRKLARRLLVGLDGTHPGLREERLILEDRVFGFVLFEKNTPDAGTTATLCAELHALAKRAGYSLTIAIDQEHGRVTRLKDGVTLFPDALHLGSEGDEWAVSQMAETTARELRALGITLNLSPVCDVPLPGIENPCLEGRTYGRDPELVSEMVSAYVRGARIGGIECCAKHFPGHGGVKQDSHLCLPHDTRLFTHILQRDLLPFAAAIEAGVDWVMTGHVAFPEADRAPASLSLVWTSSVLRDYLNFRGRVLCDDLEMHALDAFGDVTERTRKALGAGADVGIVAGMCGAGWP